MLPTVRVPEPPAKSEVSALIGEMVQRADRRPGAIGLYPKVDPGAKLSVLGPRGSSNQQLSRITHVASVKTECQTRHLPLRNAILDTGKTGISWDTGIN